MYVMTMEGGMLMSPMDICQTPLGPDLVPVPYPNIGETELAEPVCETVLICGAPALNLLSVIVPTEGDEAGVAGGVVSAEIMGEARFTEGTPTAIFEGSPAVSMNGPTTQNMDNCVGVSILTGQFVVMIMG